VRKKKQMKKKMSRVWLNTIKSMTGAMSWESCQEDHDWHEASITIRDCSRQVTLEFTYENESQRKMAIKKVDLMIKELNKFKATLGPLDET